MDSKLFFCSEKIKEICRCSPVIIYGAGVMGKSLRLCLEGEPYRKVVKAFVVNDTGRNPKRIGTTPVMGIDEASEYKNTSIIVALNDTNMREAIDELSSKGFSKLIELNAAEDDWAYLKANYFLSNPDDCFTNFSMLPENLHSDCKTECKVYVVRSIYDKPVAREMALRLYEKNIQVGAALTDTRICDLSDEKGDNISNLNRQYCELTALYWIWKHCTEDYIGISHYRRRFDIDNSNIENISACKADIIVTVPVINTAGVGQQYCITHSEADWNIVREEVHKHSPEYDRSLEIVEKQIYFHAYNMFIMRREIMNEFCDWLFPILFSCTERIGVKADSYQNRYPGFISERLLNVFLYQNREKYNIFIANKKYLT